MAETEFQQAIAELEKNPPDAETRRQTAYAEGFHDAGNLVPLFSDAAPAYRAGWLACWAARSIMARRGVDVRFALEEEPL
jgi:hypothetical protein